MKIFNLDLEKLNVNIHNFNEKEIERMMEWLDDGVDTEYKDKILHCEGINLADENVLEPINYVINSIPSNLTPLEKLRYVYISLGHLFSYDYRVIDDIRYATDKVIDMDKYVGRYQTCIQISEILAMILNSIDGLDAKVIERELVGVREEYGQKHVANEVSVINSNGEYEKYLLDLTLDLYLIQSGCRTLHFGYESGMYGEYDIIPKADTDEIDRKNEFIANNLYTDDIIKITKEKLKLARINGLSSKEIIDYRMVNMLPLIKTFPGYYEGKQYINMIFKELLKTKYKEFNLYSSDGNITNFKTVFLLDTGDYTKWIMYSNKVGILSTNEEELQSMLSTDWQTNSKTLRKVLFNKKG